LDEWDNVSKGGDIYDRKEEDTKRQDKDNLLINQIKRKKHVVKNRNKNTNKQ
jgi:hypothetical protein